MATAQKNQEASGLIASILSKPQLKIKVLPMKGRVASCLSGLGFDPDFSQLLFSYPQFLVSSFSEYLVVPKMDVKFKQSRIVLKLSLREINKMAIVLALVL